MDAQGSEPDILEHGKDTLKNTKIILTELSFYDLYTKKCSFYDIENPDSGGGGGGGGF